MCTAFYLFFKSVCFYCVVEYNKTLTEEKKIFRAWPLWRGGGRGNRHGQYRWRRASWRTSWRIWLYYSYWGRLSIPFSSVSQSDTVCIVCACPPTAAATCRTFSRGFVWNVWAFPRVWLWPGIIHAFATQAHCLSYLLAYLCQQSELQAPPASALASKTEVPLLPLPQAVQLARWCQAAYSQCASTQCGPKGAQAASAQHGIVTPGLSEKLSNTCAVQCDVPLMACVHVCTPSRAASYEGCVSWLLAMCIPCEAVCVSDRPQCELIALTTQCYKWMRWHPCLRYTSVCGHLFAAFGWIPVWQQSACSFCTWVCTSSGACCTSVALPCYYPRLTALMHLSCTCKFKFSSLQSTNGTHVCFSCCSSCHWNIWCTRGAYRYSCILWHITCGEHD